MSFSFSNKGLAKRVTSDVIRIEQMDGIQGRLLQPFVGPWPLFQIRNPIHGRQNSLDGASTLSKASAYTQDSISTE
jgi:hypothetical protein